MKKAISIMALMLMANLSFANNEVIKKEKGTNKNEAPEVLACCTQYATVEVNGSFFVSNARVCVDEGSKSAGMAKACSYALCDARELATFRAKRYTAEFQTNTWTK